MFLPEIKRHSHEICDFCDIFRLLMLNSSKRFLNGFSKVKTAGYYEIMHMNRCFQGNV